MLKYLSDEGCIDPQIVLVVAPSGPGYNRTKEYRKVVPMKDLMTYIEFHCAGPNKIFGYICEGSARTARNVYLERRNGCYSNDMLDSDGEYYTRYMLETYNQLKFAKPISVDVPAEAFAKEPSDTEKLWVNWLHRDKAIDQCEFRRRRLLAYTLQIPVCIINVLGRMAIFMAALLLGMRKISLGPILNHLTTDFFDVCEWFLGGTIFVSECEVDDSSATRFLWSVIKKTYRLPFMPPIFVAICLLVAYHVWPIMLAFGLALLLIASMFGALILQEHRVLTSFFDTAIKVLTWLLGESKKTAKSEFWYLDKDEIDLLTCNADRKPFDFKTLPVKKRSIKLRFLDLKSKVCKPYSR
jgi:hypothetical protein